jgi:hypothetical protein
MLNHRTRPQCSPPVQMYAGRERSRRPQTSRFATPERRSFVPRATTRGEKALKEGANDHGEHPSVVLPEQRDYRRHASALGVEQGLVINA